MRRNIYIVGFAIINMFEVHTIGPKAIWIEKIEK